MAIDIVKMQRTMPGNAMLKVSDMYHKAHLWWDCFARVNLSCCSCILWEKSIMNAVIRAVINDIFSSIALFLPIFRFDFCPDNLRSDDRVGDLADDIIVIIPLEMRVIHKSPAFSVSIAFVAVYSKKTSKKPHGQVNSA
nr:hypothetical protein [Candidatus Sigynarchaeota archaeon]